MVDMIESARVILWRIPVGVVIWDQTAGFARFEFESGFLSKDLDISPITMPLKEARGNPIFDFRNLSKKTYKGLPGLLADALPDSFGNKIINAWLARQGRTAESFSPIERLCYTGNRAMGALEFKPVLNKEFEKSIPIEIQELLSLTEQILNKRSSLNSNLLQQEKALKEIIKVGTSAGGMRAKAIIAYNKKTGEIRSGQVASPKGYKHWIIKFDGIKDDQMDDPEGYGRIEYAYYKMALLAGIIMTECRLLEDKQYAHFMTRRFDRTSSGEKLHMQTLCALAHFDYNKPGAYSYEQAFQVMREMRLPYQDAEQLYRRMIFNIIARNQDDHTKNISFLMNNKGEWRIAPAYDVIYAYNIGGQWTKNHQMTINNKRKNINKSDVETIGKEMNIKSYSKIIDEVIEAISQWPDLAKDSGVKKNQIITIKNVHRLSL